MPVNRSVVLCLLLAGLSLSACQDQTSSENTPAEPDLAKGSVNPVGNVQGDPRPHCQATTVPVALAQGQPTQYSIYGQLCLPPGTNGHDIPTVHLAVHGATYSHLYNAWPYQPETYSYADALMKAGYAVFTFDRIGIGQSSHPPSASVTIDANAFVVHQLVQALRSGAIEKTRFERVVLVGHSLGSITSLAEASAYSDVDGVVLTGISHAVTSSTASTLQFVPANQDPRFAGQNLDKDYLTSAPGTREAAFYYAPVTDPRVVALDEQTKETVTSAELSSFGPTLTAATSQAIHVPVLIVNGQFDQLVCGDGMALCASTATLTAAEAPFFSPQACLQTVVIPASGHDLFLEPSAPTTYAAIRSWSDAHVGLSQAAAPCKTS
jgi:pimeloyl-ACP methyl ester carboxylesterase